MHAERLRGLPLVFLAACCFLGVGSRATARSGSPFQANIAPASQPEPLAWDAVTKQQETKPGQATADFFFSVTNISTTNVVIDHVQTSCGCTVAKLPSKPWVLKPKEGGKIDVTVDLRNKSGTIFKTITVFLSNAPPKQLTVQVTIPQNTEMDRVRNQQMATADRQAVFKNQQCASCHVEKGRGKTGKELFAASCGICHEAEHRATMVPDLHALNHSTDRIYWKQWITYGKVGSMMPAFGVEQGGPLNAEQIDSLVDYLDKAIPHNPQSTTTAQASVPLPSSAPVIPRVIPPPPPSGSVK